MEIKTVCKVNEVTQSDEPTDSHRPTLHTFKVVAAMQGAHQHITISLGFSIFSKTL